MGVDDHYGLSLGYNFNRILGVEFAADFFERDLDLDGMGGIGEEAVSSFIPQLRVRYPVLKDRLVPYVVMGAGPAVLQFNDRKPGGFGHAIDADVTRAGFVVGGGLEYFLADNVAVGFEGKYLWMDEVDVMVDGVAYPKDLSSFMGALSLRVYFSENFPRPLVEESPPSPSRLYFGIQYGGAVLTDDRITSNVKLDAEASAWGGLFNQVGGLRLGADLGSNWGWSLRWMSPKATWPWTTSAPWGSTRSIRPWSSSACVNPLVGGAGCLISWLAAASCTASSTTRKSPVRG
ncbi:MAG: porin family protein [Verrucomicrobia bacterium]|nr:porin family protein [Verrucomicrobiota bacterium]